MNDPDEKKSAPELTQSSPTPPANTAHTQPAELEIPIIVGIGASAGGLQALNELFKALPDSTGMAFIVVQHLSADHDSMLPSLLSRKTAMPVLEIQPNIRVKPNQVYIISPGYYLGLIHGCLQLLPSDEIKGVLQIDYFFQALAGDLQNRAIGVLLSGNGSDGTLGMRSIKAEGGITFAQREDSAQFPSMPQSAINAGCVDVIGTPQEIAGHLVDFSKHNVMLRPAILPTSEENLNKIFFLLRRHTGHDFSHYKRTTLMRRIKRRMLLHHVTRLDHYVRLLQQDSNEIERLFNDILINVTSFFRDPETYDVLKNEILPHLLTDKSGRKNIRVWVPGCSTGEEPYSIAIALQEFLSERYLSVGSVQIFATDIDQKAISIARAGIYPETAMREMSPQRLARFFSKVSNGYQINKQIRDWCIFSMQDVARDPPFSNLDLICCRNLLIYLDASLQKKIFAIFHFALLPTGMLMLGNSETINHATELFRSAHKKARFFEKKSASMRVTYQKNDLNLARNATPSVSAEESTMKRSIQREAEQHVLDRYSPPGVIINQNMDILGFIGRPGKFIDPMAGSASLKLLKMTHRDLASELHMAAMAAIRDNAEHFRENVPFRHDNEDNYVDIRITPLQRQEASGRCFLVVFEPPSAIAPAPIKNKSRRKPSREQRDNARVKSLEQELLNTRQEMQTIINDQIAVNEELQTANEEVYSANEELQSTNEELESAKEELQSTNEELATVNDELESRNTELAQANNDLSNLLNSVNLPMLMLSLDCRIRQFTPAAKHLLNIIDSDVGRPFSNLRPNIDIAGLDQTITEVIDTITPKVIEARDNKCRWYSVSIRPYKTVDNRIAGAVLVFFDISDIKQDPEQKERLAAIVRDSQDAITLVGADGALLAWNLGAERLYGYTETEALTMPFINLVPETARSELLEQFNAVISGEAVDSFESQRITKSGDRLDVWTTVSGLRDPSGLVYATALTERNMLPIKHRIQRTDSVLAAIDQCRAVFLATDLNGDIVCWNRAAEQQYGYTEREALTMNVARLFSTEQEAEKHQAFIRTLESGEAINQQDQQRKTKSGKIFTASVIATQLMSDSVPIGVMLLERHQ